MKYLIFISLFLLSANLQAQNQLVQTATQNYSINSQYLKDGATNYYIHLPSDYEISKKSYPVLYVLDGQMHFTSAVAIQHSLGNSTDVPEMIIVGIENSYPKRKDLVWREKERFVSFLSNELIPLIDKKYRTKPERIVFGWEMGSNFA
ncbi:MAG: alpha/beta hydrolase-fold protein [Colwellia sp.]|nr:alpha/beta hydrolase-fold protein [Colwellia sp.]